MYSVFREKTHKKLVLEHADEKRTSINSDSSFVMEENLMLSDMKRVLRYCCRIASAAIPGQPVLAA